MSATPPPIHVVRSLKLPFYEYNRLDNGMDLYTLNGASEPVMKLEIVFRAGASTETKTGVAECMASLLSEGTKSLSSAQLAEKIESYGATLQTRGGVDTIRIRLYTLTRFFPELMELVYDLMTRPAFDPGELEVFISNKIERLEIDLRKNEILAYRHLTEAIYGPTHPYGKNAIPGDYRQITVEDLAAHYAQHILPGKGMVFLSGSFGDQETLLLNEVLNRWTRQSPNGEQRLMQPEAVSRTGYLEIDGPQSHQAAIRIGRRLFTQHHPDFDGIFVLNTILGGYFGSRLMNEVRENQGLTYGIYSGVDTFESDGCFYISTETTTGQIDKVIAAVRHEASRLQEDLIPESELQMAKNYLMGHLMTQLDGPFSVMDYVKTLKIEHLEDGSFDRIVDTIQQITPGQLRDLAIRYLNLDQWATVVVR